MDVNVFLELIASNGFSTAATIAIALYFKKINEDNRSDNKDREEESRKREDTLINKLQTVNDTNKDLASVSIELTKTNAEIAQTNFLLAKEMKQGLCDIDDKLIELIESNKAKD